jgi:hypothetical protein
MHDLRSTTFAFIILIFTIRDEAPLHSRHSNIKHNHVTPLIRSRSGTVPYKQVKRRRSTKGGGKGAKTQAAAGHGAASDSDGTAAGAEDDGLDDAAAAAAGADNETSLYGQWQVLRHVPVPLVDGRVPVNAHGNFELWSR